MSESERRYKEGAQVVFHLKSVGAQYIPTQTGMSFDFPMLCGIIRGETRRGWIMDITSIQPIVVNALIHEDDIDIIGEKGELSTPSTGKVFEP